MAPSIVRKPSSATRPATKVVVRASGADDGVLQPDVARGVDRGRQRVDAGRGPPTAGRRRLRVRRVLDRRDRADPGQADGREGMEQRDRDRDPPHEGVPAQLGSGAATATAAALSSTAALSARAFTSPYRSGRPPR